MAESLSYVYGILDSPDTSNRTATVRSVECFEYVSGAELGPGGRVLETCYRQAARIGAAEDKDWICRGPAHRFGRAIPCHLIIPLLPSPLLPAPNWIKLGSFADTYWG